MAQYTFRVTGKGQYNAPKGAGPIVLSNGGTSYRGFLEDRIDGDKYCLILELKAL